MIQRTGKRIEIINYSLIVLSFTVFFVFLLGSNNFDWDYVYSTLETDLRSWFLDNRPPLWSYQFCGGVTRLGNPQAFGLSPLFIFVTIFGSYWGAKVLVLFSSVVGFVFCHKLVCFFYKKSIPDNSLAHTFLYLLSIYFIFNNYFLWHFHHGHLTHILTYYGLGILYYCLTAIERGINKKEVFYACLLIWIYCSGGFYHSGVFFLLPFYISLVIYWLFKLLLVFQSSRDAKKAFITNTAKLMGIHVIGFGLSFYKIWGVLSYQKTLPRTLPSTYLNEVDHLYNFFVYHFIPSWNYDFLLPLKNQRGAIWEYSSFCLNSWLLILLLVSYLLYKKKLVIFRNKLTYFITFYMFISIALSLGSFADYAPFSILSKALSHSVRVVGRFQIGISLNIVLLIATLYTFLSEDRIGKWLIVIAMAFIPIFFLNYFTFNTFNLNQFKKIMEYENTPVEKMRNISFVKSRVLNGSVDDLNSFMYEAILSGKSVINCYEPMNRPTLLANEFTLTFDEPKEFYFIENAKTGKLPESCLKESYFSQQDIFLHESCPKDSRVLLNGFNIYHLFRSNESKGLLQN